MINNATSYIDAAIRRFDDNLNRARFRTLSCGDSLNDWEWAGRLGPQRELVTIKLQEGFPFTAPSVTLPGRVGTSDWHQTADGVLCLWDTHTQGDLPWLTVSQLLARVEEWMHHAAGGWTADSPQLDLEAYNNPRIIVRKSDVLLPVLVVNAWDDIAGHWFRAALPAVTGLMEVQRAGLLAPPPIHAAKARRCRRKKHKSAVRPDKFVNGVAVDLGEMTQPLISTDDLVDALGAHRFEVGGLLEAGRSVLIAARYTRGRGQGLIGFWLERQGDGVIRECLPVVERVASQHRRAGWHSSVIADRSVSVVGAGSVGSYLADLLHRSGVQDLYVHDSDVLLPGNVVRHSASPACIGSMKADAVRETAVARDPSWPIHARGRVSDLSEAVSLLQERDLVVDCTGDRRTWHLMRAAADIVGVPFLHVAVMGHGQHGRVDIYPPFDNAAPLDEDPVRSVSLTEWEGGCGDPISPTPPAAVVETAAMGSRFAIRILAGEKVPPAGESRALFPDVP